MYDTTAILNVTPEHVSWALKGIFRLLLAQNAFCPVNARFNFFLSHQAFRQVKRLTRKIALKQCYDESQKGIERFIIL